MWVVSQVHVPATSLLTILSFLLITFLFTIYWHLLVYAPRSMPQSHLHPSRELSVGTCKSTSLWACPTGPWVSQPLLIREQNLYAGRGKAKGQDPGWASGSDYERLLLLLPPSKWRCCHSGTRTTLALPHQQDGSSLPASFLTSFGFELSLMLMLMAAGK